MYLELDVGYNVPRDDAELKKKIEERMDARRKGKECWYKHTVTNLNLSNDRYHCRCHLGSVENLFQMVRIGIFLIDMQTMSPPPNILREF
jgi:hypothetical protein